MKHGKPLLRRLMPLVWPAEPYTKLNRNGRGCSTWPRRKGGVRAQGKPSDTSKFIMEVYDNTPCFSGIIGGFEVGEYHYYHYFT